MTMKCIICSHPKRLEVDRKIVNRANLSQLAKKFELSYNSLNNHARNHVSRQLAQAMEKKQLATDFDLLSRIDKILVRSENIFQRNYDAKRDGMALKALSEQRSTFDLLARISYQLHQAKLAEAELIRLKSGETSEQEKKESEKQLKILTIDELEVLADLSIKMQNQDKSMVVIPEKPKKFQYLSDLRLNWSKAPTHDVKTLE